MEHEGYAGWQPEMGLFSEDGCLWYCPGGWHQTPKVAFNAPTPLPAKVKLAVVLEDEADARSEPRVAKSN